MVKERQGEEMDLPKPQLDSILSSMGEYGLSTSAKPNDADAKGHHMQSPSVMDVMKPLFYVDVKSNQSENNFGSDKASSANNAKPSLAYNMGLVEGAILSPGARPSSQSSASPDR